MAHYDVYREQLASLYHGHALWEPDPAGLYECVDVGDVGYIRQGHFHRLFNILLPADDPSHVNLGVPDNYDPLSVSSTHLRTLSLPRGDYYSYNVCNYSVTLGARISACERKQGAALFLPAGAQRKDSTELRGFRKYILEHAESWLIFAQRKNLDVDHLEELVLVTGCDMTQSWALAAFTNVGTKGDIAFDADLLGGSVSSPKIHWHATIQKGTSVPYNYGPRPEQVPASNQCVFIRGYRVKKRALQFLPSKLLAAAGPHSLNDRGPDEEGQPTVVSESEDDSEINFCDPLNAVLDFVLDRMPQIEMAIVHDDDLKFVQGIETLSAKAISQYLERLNIPHRTLLRLAAAQLPDIFNVIGQEATPSSPSNQGIVDPTTIVDGFVGSGLGSDSSSSVAVSYPIKRHLSAIPGDFPLLIMRDPWPRASDRTDGLLLDLPLSITSGMETQLSPANQDEGTTLENRDTVPITARAQYYAHHVVNEDHLHHSLPSASGGPSRGWSTVNAPLKLDTELDLLSGWQGFQLDPSEFSLPSGPEQRQKANTEEVYATPEDSPPPYTRRLDSSSSHTSAIATKESTPKGSPSNSTTQTSEGYRNLTPIETTLLAGISFGFRKPLIDMRSNIMLDPIPNIVILPTERPFVPLHIQASTWKQLIKFMGSTPQTCIKPRSMANGRRRSWFSEPDPAYLQVVIHFIRDHPTSEDWRTVVYLTVNHEPPAFPLGSLHGTFTKGTSDQLTSVLPSSYSSDILLPFTLLSDDLDSSLSKIYAMPHTTSSRQPKLPITFQDLASYLCNSLQNSRVAHGTSGRVRRLAYLVDACYPQDSSSPAPPGGGASSGPSKMSRPIGDDDVFKIERRSPRATSLSEEENKL